MEDIKGRSLTATKRTEVRHFQYDLSLQCGHIVRKVEKVYCFLLVHHLSPVRCGSQVWAGEVNGSVRDSTVLYDLSLST